MGRVEGMGGNVGYRVFWVIGRGDLDGEKRRQDRFGHGRYAGFLLRGTALLKWIEEGQQKWIYEGDGSFGQRG